MSYEGYIDKICKLGHLNSYDCYYECDKKCPNCGSDFVFENSVDLTNGEYALIDGVKYLIMTGEIEYEIDKTLCKKQKDPQETHYKIPKNLRKSRLKTFVKKIKDFNHNIQDYVEMDYFSRKDLKILKKLKIID